MNRISPRSRAVLGLVCIGILVGLYLSLIETTGEAQDRPAPKRKATFAEFSKSDEVTSEIRDRGNELVRVEFKSIDDREKAKRFGRIVAEYGSFAVIVKQKTRDMSRSGLEVETIKTKIHLPGVEFEPVEAPPAETVRPGVTPVKDRGYYIVQFAGPASDEWLDSIRDAGVEVVQYIPNQAFIVHGSRSAVQKVVGHSRVRWTGEFVAQHKVPADVATRLAEGGQGVAVFEVAVFRRADIESVAAQLPGRVLAVSKLPNNFFNLIRVEMPVSEVGRVAALTDVFRIDPFIQPVKEDERAAQIVAGNYSGPTTIDAPGYNPLAQFGADGTGVTVMVSDDGISIPGNGGLYITAANTVDGPLRGATPGASGGHGHINASIIAGSTPFGMLDPLGYNYGMGIAPKANIINIPFLKTGNTTTDAQAVDDALNTVGPNGARGTISNNSWGAGTNGNSYDSLAAQYDGFVQDGSLAPSIDPFLIVFSAGNCGTAPAGSACNSESGLTRPKVSKNTIAVANSENIRTASPNTGANNLEDITSSSSIGLAADGRIKPDITAPGTGITGSRAGTSCNTVSSCFDVNHSWSTGTSHAAPQVAGAAALFTQYWRNGHAGASPSPALIKAAIINSAQEMNGTNSGAAVPNGREGWGRINMKGMMNTGVPMMYIDQEVVFSSVGIGQAMIGTVADPSKPVRVTLVWTDPPGAGNPALVNNLDLQVNVNGNFYRGNVFSGGVSTTGGTADSINNVENVFLPAGIPAGSFFSVGVTSVGLNGDGVLGNGDTTDQHFAIVAYNFRPLELPDHPPVDFDGDRRTDVSIFRPAGGEWWYNRSSDNQTVAFQFGNSSDHLVPADYTGDGKTDVAIWRPSEGQLYVLRSEDGSFYAIPFGISTDLFVAGDFDGDRKADPAVFRQSNSTWYVLKSGGGVDVVQFGASTDLPVPADYDGDNKTDIAIFRPNGGEWWINRSTGGVTAMQFGSSTDKLVPGDYTGDGKADVALWRPGTGEWFVLRSEDGSFFAVPFGTTGDVPVPGDYDGDGKFDRAIFRPSDATWYVDRSTAGILIRQFGLTGDTAVPSVFVR
jgi:putative transposon-encoded protein